MTGEEAKRLQRGDKVLYEELRWPYQELEAHVKSVTVLPDNQGVVVGVFVSKLGRTYYPRLARLHSSPPR